VIGHLDFFSGPGGICTGFKSAGIQTLCAVEKVSSCVETYSANHPEVRVITKNIRSVKNAELKDYKDQKVQIITSGMPCETFSTAGSKSRSFYDSRQNLYYETIRVSKYLKPELILFENVVGITSKKTQLNGDRLIIDEIQDDLCKIGYKNQFSTILDATNYGVPQSRKRYFLLASRDQTLKLSAPAITHEKAISVSDAFRGLPLNLANSSEDYGDYTGEESNFTRQLKDVEFWRTESKSIGARPTYHRAPKHRRTTLQRFRLIKPGENLKDAFLKHSPVRLKELQDEKILPKKWFIQRNMRLVSAKPSKTITSHCLDELIHPKLDRALTVREVARLQSFPDNYDFKGGPYLCPHLYETQDKYEQIGDAVPPLLARAWGLHLRKILGA
jgi:DNA (cytosine-5)-methyltransferase 1